MNPGTLRYLRSVVEEGSFAAAAKACSVSQSAITQAMQQLERHWGCALFERSGRRKVPTAKALIAVQQAAQLLDPLRELMATGPRLNLTTGRRQVLRVGMAPAAALFYGPLIEDTWHDYEPAGLLRILITGAADSLLAFQRGALDLVIAPRPRGVRFGHVQQHVLHRSSLSICARERHPLRSARSLAELTGVKWAVAGNQGTPGNAVEEALRVRKLPPPLIAVECADYNMLLHLVAHSDLLCVVPHPALLEQRKELGVRILRVRESLPLYEVLLYWNLPAAPGLQRVIDALQRFVPQDKGA